MKINISRVLGIVAIAGAVSLFGCGKEPGTAEKAGAAVDKAAEKTVEAANTAAEKTAEAAKKAADATKEGAEKAVDKTGEAVEKAEKTGEDMHR